MKLSFLAAFGKAKLGTISDKLIQAIVQYDPETASEAQIAEFEKNLDIITQRVGVLRGKYKKERDEAEQAQANYDKLMRAAEKLNADLQDPGQSAKHAAITASLTGLMRKLEGLVPEVERENKEAEEAKKVLDQFEKAASDAALKVTTGKQKLENARRGMESARLKRENAEENAEQAAVLAGIRTQSDSLSTALDAMSAVTRKDEEAAEGLNVKAELLTKNTPQAAEDDPLVLEAMGESSEGTEQLSLSERLAALKAKQ